MIDRSRVGAKICCLTDDQIEQVHSSSLEVLRRAGMRSKSKRILEVFAKGGAETNFGDCSVRIPEYLVKEALKSAPKRFMLHGRDSRNDILLEGDRIYFGFGGTPMPFIRDIDTGEFRQPTKKDCIDSARVGNALPNMKFVMSNAGAYDVPPQVEFLHEWDVLFNSTLKPIVYGVPGAYNARKVLEMASLIAGGFQELRKRPMLAGYMESVAPLTFPELNENMIEFASAGVPIVHGGGPMVGVTGPGTLVGSLVQTNAENLAVVVLTQLVNKGTPIVFSGQIAILDPRTGRSCYSAPEYAFGLGTLMAKHYGLPSWGAAGTTDSKVPDAQAGAEYAFRALASAISGANLIHDCGYLASGSVGSLEMAVIMDEIVGMISRFMRGVQFDQERLATDVICEVGHERHFMSHKHTLKYIRGEVWVPEIFDRRPEQSWIRSGKKDIRQVANEKVKKILREHHPEALPGDIRQGLTEILKEAEKELAR